MKPSRFYSHGTFRNSWKILPHTSYFDFGAPKERFITSVTLHLTFSIIPEGTFSYFCKTWPNQIFYHFFCIIINKITVLLLTSVTIGHSKMIQQFFHKIIKTSPFFWSENSTAASTFTWTSLTNQITMAITLKWFS